MIDKNLCVKSGQIYEVIYSNGKSNKFVVTAVDKEPDTGELVCFLLSTKGIGQVSYCEDLIHHSRLLKECNTWQEAVNHSLFNEEIHVLH